jgi:NAD(P)-dependent dehydrogenase (short-subunit alcohol dehydrogenase family)
MLALEDLENKVALITGGTGGIGSAVAVELARRGMDLALDGLSADHERAACVKSRVETLGRRCCLIAADIGVPEEARRCVKDAFECYGRLDVLVHCAGGPAPGSLLEVSAEDWYRAFDVHVHAVFHLCRAAVPRMRGNGGGAIVLVSSAAGTRGCSGAIAYGVAKGAIPQFTRSLARELADDSIRVNCVCPGVIRTPFQNVLTLEQVRDNIERRIPLHREGTPEDVAEVIALLVTNQFITGENVVVDGGMTMRMP